MFWLILAIVVPPAGIVLMVVFALAFVIGYLNYKRTYVKIEDGVVTGHRGIIRTKKLVSPVSKVQDVSVSNGLWGKIFKYYTITISTAGSAGAEYVFDHMANAQEFQALFAELTK